MKQHVPSAPRGLALFTLLVASTSSSCNCGPKIKAIHPLAVLDKTLAFGGVPVQEQASHVLNISNQGSAELNVRTFSIDKTTLFAGPFDPDGGAPLSVVTVEPGATTQVNVTYTPQRVAASANDLDTGTLTAITDDPTQPTVSVALEGFGTQAAFTLVPNLIDFGDVQLDPTLPTPTVTQSVTVTNTGSATAHVTDAAFAGLDAGFTSDPPLDHLIGSYPSGYSVSVNITFSPQDLLQHEGTLTVTTDYPPQPSLQTTIRGRGVETLYQLCKQRLFDDGGAAETPVCVPNPADSIDGGIAIPLDFGGRDEASPPAHSKVWVQNVGNQGVTVTSQLVTFPDHCPGGPYGSDFEFTSTDPSGVASDGGFINTFLDAGEQVTIDVQYTPTHHCAVGYAPDGGHPPTSDDLTDSVNLSVTRVPALNTRSLVCAITGHSLEPALVTSGINIAGTEGIDGGQAVLVQNQSVEKALTVSDAELADSSHQVCGVGSTAVECQVLAWNPSPLPVTVPVAQSEPDGGLANGSAVMGALVLLPVAPDAGTINAFLHLTTDDPHNLQADFPITIVTH
jgi:hypothetical protein